MSMSGIISTSRLPAVAIMAIGLASAGLAADPPSRADAFRAADAAAGLPEEPLDPSIPVCAAPPASGEKLAGDVKLRDEGHTMTFQNGGGGTAIVKIRHATTGKLALSFMINKLEEVTIEGVPDGVYITQYAFGPALAPDCRSFTRIIRASQLPEPDTFKTIVNDSSDGTEVKHMAVSYELSVSRSASNMKPVRIDAAAFNAD